MCFTICKPFCAESELSFVLHAVLSRRLNAGSIHVHPAISFSCRGGRFRSGPPLDGRSGRDGRGRLSIGPMIRNIMEEDLTHPVGDSVLPAAQRVYPLEHGENG
jgi:hypothetical protein